MAHRSSFRMTSFRPDQISVTAHTLTSINPSGLAKARIVSSLISVATFEDFFGQDTHKQASGLILERSKSKYFSSSDRLVVNK